MPFGFSSRYSLCIGELAALEVFVCVHEATRGSEVSGKLLGSLELDDNDATA